MVGTTSEYLDTSDCCSVAFKKSLKGACGLVLVLRVPSLDPDVSECSPRASEIGWSWNGQEASEPLF